MKKLNSIAGGLLMSVFMLVITTGYAQEKPRGDGQNKAKMEEKKNELKAKLNLSASQSEQFDAIAKKNREEARQKIQALPADATQKEKRQIMKASMEKADAEIIAILNPEQQKIFSAEKEKMKNENKEKAKKKRAGKTVTPSF